MLTDPYCSSRRRSRNYAVIDISGGTTASGVKSVAIGEDNQAAFCYFQYGSNAACYAYTWQNGVTSTKPVTSLPLVQRGVSSAAEPTVSIRQVQYVVNEVFPDGTIGGITVYEEGTFNGTPPPIPPVNEGDGLVINDDFQCALVGG
jgi:hypothetical protein